MFFHFAKMRPFRQLPRNTSDISRFVQKLDERLPITSLESYHHVFQPLHPIVMALSADGNRRVSSIQVTEDELVSLRM